jgi:hypothetical protein
LFCFYPSCLHLKYEKAALTRSIRNGTKIAIKQSSTAITLDIESGLKQIKN